MSEDVSERLHAMLARIPYAQFLGVRAELAGDEMTLIMPFAERLVGNIKLPALHGGVVGAFMEMTALAQLSISVGLARQARPAGDQLRPRPDQARRPARRQCPCRSLAGGAGAAHRRPARPFHSEARRTFDGLSARTAARRRCGARWW